MGFRGLFFLFSLFFLLTFSVSVFAEVDIRPCILERQKALGATPDLWINLNANYSFDQYQNFVDGLAPNFVSGYYSGGASGPTFLLRSAGRDAKTMGALVSVVQSMRQTTLHTNYFGLIEGKNWATDSSWTSTDCYSRTADSWSSCKGIAASNWKLVNYGSPAGRSSLSPRWGKADASVGIGKYEIKNIPTALGRSRTVTLYLLGGKNETYYNDFGSGILEGQWSKVFSQRTSEGTVTTGFVPEISNYSMQWPPSPSPSVEGVSTGFTTPGRMVIIDWDFSSCQQVLQPSICSGEKPKGAGVVFGPSTFFGQSKFNSWTNFRDLSLPCTWKCVLPSTEIYLDGKEAGCCNLDNSQVFYGKSGTVYGPYGSLESSLCCTKSQVMTYGIHGKPNGCCGIDNILYGKTGTVFAEHGANQESICCKSEEVSTYSGDGHVVGCCDTKSNNIVYGRDGTVFAKGGTKETTECCRKPDERLTSVYSFEGVPECCAVGYSARFGLDGTIYGINGVKATGECCPNGTMSEYDTYGRIRCVNSAEKCDAQTSCTNYCSDGYGHLFKHKCDLTSGKCVFDSSVQIKTYLGDDCVLTKKGIELKKCTSCGSLCSGVAQIQRYGCGADDLCQATSTDICPTGQVCIEKREAGKPVNAVCTNPVDIHSLFFNTGTPEFYHYQADGRKITFGADAQFTTENTFFGIETPEDFFSRLNGILTLVPAGQKVDIVLNNHGRPGKITFGDRQQYFDLSSVNNLDLTQYPELAKSKIGNFVFASCLIGS
ncbi:MAG: hypothetical protein WC652_06815, partial [archaeon]